MRRRSFFSLLGGAAAWPLAARAQQAGKIWRIAMLDTVGRELNSANIGAFLEKMQEYGYLEGKNFDNRLSVSGWPPRAFARAGLTTHKP
jgi:putative tryptophan/tyrosine transport system substrate-binding protein